MKKTLKIVCIICISMLCSGCITVPLAIHSKAFERFDKKTPRNAWIADYPREEVWFYSGKNKLEGFIYGRENNKGLVVISNGIHTYADHNDDIIMYLVDDGWRVFSYNYTGVGGSEGSSMRGLSQGVIDLSAALTYIENTNDFQGLPVILMGFSMGGYATPTALHFDHNVTAAVSINTFNSVKDLYKYLISDTIGPFHYFIYPQVWLLQKIRFGSDIAKLTAVDGINKTQIPVLIMVNYNDDFLPPDIIGIYAHRDSITNPYVEYIYLEGEVANGHRFPRTETFPMIKDFLERAIKNYQKPES